LLLAAGPASLLLASAASGQEAAGLRIESIDASEPPAVRVTASVLDGAGTPVLGLDAQSFSASVQGTPLPVTAVASSTDESIPISVTLVFDVSGSMSGPALEQAREAGKALVAELGAGDKVTVVAFASTVEVVQPSTSDRAALNAAIDALKAGGNTALYEAVVRAVEMSAMDGSPRRAVVLLSDGQDFGTAGETDRGTSLAAARAAAVPLFLVGLGESIDRAYLEELASTASGRLLVAPGPDALRGLYQSIGSLLRNQYVITLDASGLPGGQSVRLALRVTHAGGIAIAEAPLALPVTAPVDVEPPASPPADAEPLTRRLTPEPAGGAGSGPTYLPLLAPAAGGLAALTLLAAVIFIRRRRRRAEPPLRVPDVSPVSPGRVSEEVVPLPERTPRPARAWLELAGPRGGERYLLGDEPLTVGFSADCTVRLPQVRSSGWERVRVWRRDGRYMLHNLSRLGSVSVGDRPVTWAVLEDGDKIELGGCTLVFRLEETSAPEF
jgi:VWFA-related protein